MMFVGGDRVLKVPETPVSVWRALQKKSPSLWDAVFPQLRRPGQCGPPGFNPLTGTPAPLSLGPRFALQLDLPAWQPL